MVIEQLTLTTIIVIILVAFICEYVDSSLGMGYGTILTPVLMMFGFSPIQIVPAVLFSEFITGISAGFFHHGVGNVRLFNNEEQSKDNYKNITNIPFIDKLFSYCTNSSFIIIVLSASSIIGTIVAVFLSISLPTLFVKYYIILMTCSIGIFILLTYNKKMKFSWNKIILLGLIASFNKGISGGGYGPVVTGGQILSGVESKKAISITSLSEGLTCGVGIVLYVIFNKGVSYNLFLPLTLGALLSVPFAGITVKHIKKENLKIAIAIGIVSLGCISIIKLVVS